MTIEKAIDRVSDVMKLSAQAFADAGHKKYSAGMHSAAAGKAMSVVFGEGLVPDAKNCRAIHAATYNHSAWRQKWEKAGIFAKAQSEAEDLLDVLDQEGV